MKYPDARILIFCKAPVAGKVNTRLAPQLGEQGATALHEELAGRIIAECRRGASAPIELWCEPDTSHPFFAMLASSEECFAQQGDDLGERMAFALSASLSRGGVARAVLVGTDCPAIDVQYLEMALDKLSNHDVVIGPAEDGGYGLIGLTRAYPSLFAGMAWGSDSVCAETCRAINRQRLYWSLLPLLWDIDRPEDVARYRRMNRAI